MNNHIERTITDRQPSSKHNMHNCFGLSCFFHKPEKFRDKIRAKTCLGENIGPDVKVLVPDVKVLVPDVKRAGPQMWKYWSLDVSNCVRKCCRKS